MANNVIEPLTLTAVAEETDAGIQIDLWKGITEVISNEGANDIIEMVKYFKDTCILINGVNKTNKKEVKEKSREFCFLFWCFTSSCNWGMF